jgi:hypothetical protein
VEEIYPHQWTERSPGSFTYTYILTSTTRRSIYLAINATNLGRLDISNIQQMPPTFNMINASDPLIAGEPINLQLSSSVTNYASLAGNSTGCRVQLVRPDGSSVDLGLMADWAVVAGALYNWNMTVPGSNLTQVSNSRCCVSLRIACGTVRGVLSVHTQVHVCKKSHSMLCLSNQLQVLSTH